MKIDMNDPRFAYAPHRVMWVYLTDAERGHAMEIGQYRNKEQRKRSEFDPKIAYNGLLIDQQGAMAEAAFAKAFGLMWDGKFFDIDSWLAYWQQHGHDVGGFEVRSTDAYFGRLLIHPPKGVDPNNPKRGDDPHRQFVLVRTHMCPWFEIAGWFWAGQAQARPDWWEHLGNHNKPAFCVPNSVLHGPELLWGYVRRSAA